MPPAEPPSGEARGAALPRSTPPPGAALAQAYSVCSRLARTHYENFPVGSWLLPRHVRPAVHAVYAYARGADDIADEPRHASRRLEGLDRWEAMLDQALAGRSRDPVFMAVADTIQRHRLPVQLFRDLLTAFRMDARGTRFETWEDLLGYCRYSANPVGRILLRLFGYDSPRTDLLSDHLCTALQLTNFWQDLAADLSRGRVYLPRKEMEELGLANNTKVLSGRSGGLAQGFMGAQISRTRLIFEVAHPLPEALKPPLSLEVRAIAAGGRRILDRLERTGPDPLGRRVRLNWLDRLAIFWQALAPSRPAPAR